MNPDQSSIANALSVPITLSQQNIDRTIPQPALWSWEKYLPLGGITLLDGDHSTGKSLLALQIAACVSSGAAMPDGTPTIQGDVIIITPTTNTATQRPLLSALGADLSHIETISFIQEPNATLEPHARPFTLPEDLIHLFNSLNHKRVRLIILDPFITLLSRHQRCTNERLCHLLLDLNQRLIERQIACLIVRNCGARGSQARPSVLEKSDHFPTIAISRLLLAPDPFQPDRLLLSHAKSAYCAPGPTLTFQIESPPNHPTQPYMVVQGIHSLQATDLLTYRPDVLHRQLLSRHLLRIISDNARPIHVSALYAQSPHSSPFQVQRSLNDLLNMGQIARPSRGFYSPTPANPVSKPNPQDLSEEEEIELWVQDAIAKIKKEKREELAKAQAVRHAPRGELAMEPHMARLLQAMEADEELQELFDQLRPHWEQQADPTPATTPSPASVTSPDPAAATTSPPQPATALDPTAATTSPPESANSPGHPT